MPGPSGSGPDTVLAGVRPKRGSRRLRVFVAGGLAVALLLGGGAAAAFLRMRGAPEQILGEIPASTDAIVVAYLDPAASQKLNLLRLQGRFPSLASSQHLRDQVNAGLDAALRDSGLDHRDVAWVGSEIAIAVDIRPQGDPGVAVLLSVDDAGAADATLQKLRTEPASNPSSWTRVTHGGVDVWSGTEASGSEVTMAMVEGVAVLSNSRSMVEGAIDAGQGTVARLKDDARFRATMSDLPEAKLGFAYLNTATLGDLLAQSPAFGAAAAGPGLGALSAVTSVAVSVSAQPDGLAIDTTQRYDRSKLTPEMLRVLAQPPHVNPLLTEVPAAAYGVIAQQHVDAALRSFVDTLGAGSPGVGGPFGAAEIGNLVQVLTGDLAIEAESGGPVAPDAAILLGSSDDERIQSELDRLAAVSASSGARWRIEAYRGVTIHVLVGEEFLPFVPAYAVVDHAAVIATSDAEIKRIVDTSKGGPNITSSPVFRATTAGSEASDAGSEASDALAFVDVQRVVAAVRGALPLEQRAWFDWHVAPDLRNVVSFSFRSDDEVTGSRSRVFVRIR
jgi:hypothetical protein